MQFFHQGLTQKLYCFLKIDSLCISCVFNFFNENLIGQIFQKFCIGTLLCFVKTIFYPKLLAAFLHHGNNWKLFSFEKLFKCKIFCFIALNGNLICWKWKNFHMRMVRLVVPTHLSPKILTQFLPPGSQQTIFSMKRITR